jgi:LemA protein
MSAQTPDAKGDAERGLSAALGKLFALAEAYPQLRAAENFSQLQGALAQIEEAVQNARRYYNAVVRDFNTKIAQVPWNLLAGIFGFRSREFFQVADDAERAVPSVKFN